MKKLTWIEKLAITRALLSAPPRGHEPSFEYVGLDELLLHLKAERPKLQPRPDEIGYT